MCGDFESEIREFHFDKLGRHVKSGIVGNFTVTFDVSGDFVEVIFSSFTITFDVYGDFVKVKSPDFTSTKSPDTCGPKL